MMVGQDKLKARLMGCWDVSELPNSIILIGEVGCGKHTLANEVASYYGLPLVDITKSISPESIEQIYLNPTQAFYLVDLDGTTEKGQNALLKFVEEPLANSHLVLLSSSRGRVLGTILNRCVPYEFAPYTEEELRGFMKGEGDEVLALCATPGQIISLNEKSLAGLNGLCDNMVRNIGKARYPNALSIAKKINYKDEYDKYDLKVFLKCLRLHLMKDYIDTNSKASYDMYGMVCKTEFLLTYPTINKEYCMEDLITRLWERGKDEAKRA